MTVLTKQKLLGTGSNTKGTKGEVDNPDSRSEDPDDCSGYVGCDPPHGRVFKPEDQPELLAVIISGISVLMHHVFQLGHDVGSSIISTQTYHTALLDILLDFFHCILS